MERLYKVGVLWASSYALIKAQFKVITSEVQEEEEEEKDDD
jgi:hypothetical protein